MSQPTFWNDESLAKLVQAMELAQKHGTSVEIPFPGVIRVRAKRLDDPPRRQQPSQVH